MLSAEATPLVKVGGLGDVVGSLPSALRDLGHDVRIFLPHYPELEYEDYAPKAHKLLSIQWNEADYYSMPLELDVNGIPYYLVGGSPVWADKRVYSDLHVDGSKFVFFALMALKLARSVGFQPDILHVHDAHPAAAIYWLSTIGKENEFWRDTRSVFTIHNLPFQMNHIGPSLARGGLLPAQVERIPYWARDGLMGLGLNYADQINAVSKGYAAEILGEEMGAGLQELVQLRADEGALSGIVNGIDYTAWDPSADSAIAHAFDAANLAGKAKNKAALQTEFGLPQRADVPLLGVVSRLDHQKGFDLFAPTLHQILSENDVQLALLGTGHKEIESELWALKIAFPDKVSINIRFDGALARRIYAASDMFLMPSRYEPCGLGQLIAMRYGAVPVVRAVGGLRDTVVDHRQFPKTSTGFTFNGYTSVAFGIAIQRAIDVYKDRAAWAAICQRAMAQDFSWTQSAEEYVRLYESALAD